MTDRLNGKVALVTGAARGIGRAIAVALAADGADVIAFDVAAPLQHAPYPSATPEDLAETVRLVEAQHRRIVAAAVDVRDSSTLRRELDGAVRELGGGLDVVVANAGVCLVSTWDEITEEDFRYVMDVNVTGTWNTVMAAAPHVIATGRGGSIVLTSSYAGLNVQPFMVHYTASKHAVTGLAKAFAAELGPHDIRVNSIHPSAVRTSMGEGDTHVAIERAAESNPLLAGSTKTLLPQRYMEPSEVAAAVLFLVGDEATFITATPLRLDGGMTEF